MFTILQLLQVGLKLNVKRKDIHALHQTLMAEVVNNLKLYMFLLLL